MNEEGVLATKDPEELFGKDPDKAKEKYKELIVAYHPDLVGGDGETASHINRLWHIASVRITEGSYGKKTARFADAIIVQSRRHGYRVRRFIGQDSIANYYEADYKVDENCVEDVLFKVSRSSRDNDLLVNESKILKDLLMNVVDFDILQPFLPAYIETFGFRSKGKKPLQTNVFTAPQYRFYTLEEVHAYYPVLHPKDMAWMLRRLLTVLALIHTNDVIHGAVLPGNILIQPENHGLMLDNFLYSTKGDALKAIDPSYKDFYPDEVLSKEVPWPGTDIYMAIQSMRYLLGSNIPKQLNAFFNGCTQKRVKTRPQDAFGLLEEFNELIENMWGPRRFRPFHMPI